MNAVRRLVVLLMLVAILLAFLPFLSNPSPVYAQSTCQISSQSPSTNSVILFSNLNPNLHYRIRMERVGSPPGFLVSNLTITGVSQYAFAIPNSSTYPDGDYFMDLGGFDSAANAQNATQALNTPGRLDICSFNEGNGFTLTRGQTPVTPPPSAENCEPGADGFTINSPKSSYFVDEDITASTIIHNCETIGIFYLRNDSNQDTVGNYGGDTQISLNGNSNVTANLKFLAEGEWRINAYLLTGGSPILENDLIINIIPRPELQGVPSPIALGEEASFEVINCPSPMELRLDGERINEQVDLSRADSTTVSVTIPGSFFEEEGDYTVDATCAGGNTNEKTISVEEEEEEEEPIKCPVCPDGFPYYTKYNGMCCRLQGCRMPADAETSEFITEPDPDAENATCQPGQICHEGRGCKFFPDEPQKPPCADETCSSVQAGDTALGLSFPTDPAGFIRVLLGILLSVSGMVAVALIIRSGYQYMTSRGNPDTIQEARDRLTSAIVGLLFIIFSLVILQVIGVDILKIPGFTN